MVIDKFLLSVEGEYATPEEMQRAARIKFLQLCEKYAPAAVQDLVPAWLSWQGSTWTQRAGGYEFLEAPWWERPIQLWQHQVEEWAVKYHLTLNGEVPAWIVEHVGQTFDFWITEPRHRGKRWAAWIAGESEESPEWQAFEKMEAAWTRIEAAGAAIKLHNPSLTEAQAMTKAMVGQPALYDAYNAAEKQALKPLPQQRKGKARAHKRKALHFRWAVRFQIAGLDYRVICPLNRKVTSSITQHAVRTAVKQVLRLVGLKPRRAKDGRPRTRSIQTPSTPPSKP